MADKGSRRKPQLGSQAWRDYTRFGRALLVAAVLSVLLSFAAAPPSPADDRERYQQRVEKAVGALAAGGKGALTGGPLGAGAGTAAAALTGKKNFVLPAATRLSFKLNQSLTLPAKS